MTLVQMIEVAIATVLFVTGIFAFRRGGSQGAVILFVVAALLLIHGLGLLNYHPSPSELGQ